VRRLLGFFVFGVVCIVASIASGCGKPAATGVFVDPAFVPLLPPDVRVIAGVRIDKIKDTPLYKEHKGELDLPQLNELAARTGLDLKRDIWSLLIASNGKDSMALARGRFTVGELEPKLGALGARRTSYKTYTLIGDERNSAVFLNPGVAAAGRADSLRALIDRRNADNGGIPADLQQGLSTLPKDNQIYLVSRGIPTELFPSRSEVQSALSNIVGYVTNITLGVGFDQGAHLTSDLTCVSEQGAKRVNDALRGGIGFARLAVKDKEIDLLRLFDSVHIDQQKEQIHVQADLAPDLVETLLKRIR
jgi:hypothetical protein